MSTPVPDRPVRTTAVVVAWQAAQRLAGCLDALLAEEGLAVLVVDNASTDGTAALLAGYPEVEVLTAPRNLGFAGGAALGLAAVRTELAALVNDDAAVRPGWLAALEAHLDADPGCALVTGKILLRDGRVNSAGGVIDRLGHGRDLGYGAADDGSFDTVREVFHAPATACLLRTAAAREVGLLDPRYFLYHEDVDLAWRLRLAGWTVAYTPAAVADHDHGASTGASGGSALHSFHDARNRLLTLVKDATGARAAAGVLRLPLTAVSLLLKALLTRGPDRPAAVRHAVQVGRAFPGLLRLLPHALAQRRRIGAAATVSRAEVEARAAALAGEAW